MHARSMLSGRWLRAALLVSAAIAAPERLAAQGCTPTPVNVPSTTTATLTNACVYTGTNTWVKVYSFQGTAGQQISITMSSAAFDTYLVLASPSRALLAEDDDSGGGTNSRIPAGTGTFTLPTTGTYTIEASALFDNQGGAFTLTIASSSNLQLTIQQLLSQTCPSNSLIVSVTSNGAPVSNLTTSNFTLTESGSVRPITVTPLGSTSAALSLAIVIDTSGSLSSTDLANEKAAALQMINQLSANDEVAVYSFEGTVTLVQNFTTNRALLTNAINSISDGGSTALYDAITRAANALATRTGRKAMVLMTDGEDNASSATLASSIGAAQAAGTPVFPVGFGSADQAILTQIANQTGGFYTPAATSANLTQILQAIGQTLVTQYQVNYTSANGTIGHNLVLTVNSGGQTASATRTSTACPTNVSLSINQVITTTCPTNKLIVSVVNGSQPVTGLTTSNFSLTENNQLRPITVNSASASGGLSLSLVIDRSTSLSNIDLSNEKAAAVELVNQLGAADAVSLYTISSQAALVQNFTSDRPTINAAINGVTLAGSTALYDAIVLAVQGLNPRTGRKAIVLMTDGEDNNSSATLTSSIAAAVAAGIPVFTIGFGSADAAVLTQIATQTGAFYSPAATSASLQAILQAIGLTLSNQYEITYTSASPSVAQNLSLTVTIPGGATSIPATRTVAACSVVPTAVTLSSTNLSAQPGTAIRVPVNIASSTQPGSLQFDFTYDPSRLTLTSVTRDTVLINAGKDVSTAPLTASSRRVSTIGTAGTSITNGGLCTLNFTLASGLALGTTTPITFSNCSSVSPQGVALATTCAVGSTITVGACSCDVNADGATNVADIQLIVNQVLGVIAATCDVNRDGSINVADVQRVINAALGQACN